MVESEKNKVEKCTLYLVGTPIGNLADMSERAIKVLSEVDFVAAEDTRNSGRLLSYFGISKPLISYYEHNKKERGEEIVQRLISGESCALITDAGMPAISDPGEDLVRLCAEKNIKVTTIPGACAMITALTLSALSTSQFVFEGFLPVPKKERKERLEALTLETRTFILYEAPHKLRTTLSDLCEILGENRKLAICRELTKINEEVQRVTLKEACELYSNREPRGEYVLVIEGGEKTVASEKGILRSKEELQKAVDELCSRGIGKNAAIKTVASENGMTRNQLYDMLIEK